MNDIPNDKDHGRRLVDKAKHTREVTHLTRPPRLKTETHKANLKRTPKEKKS